MKNRYYYLIVFLFLIINHSQAQFCYNRFENQHYSTVFNSSSDPYKFSNSGDVNGDGWKDIVTLNNLGTEISLGINDGQGDFTFTDISIPLLGAADIHLADITLNGFPELLITMFNTNELYIYSIQGNSLILHSVVNTLDGPFGIISGDFNNNGAVDIAITNKTDNSVSLFLNQGGLISSQSDFNVGLSPEKIIFNEFTNEFLIACSGSNEVRIYGIDNNQNLQLTYIHNGIVNPKDLSFTDYDQDGLRDLLILTKSLISPLEDKIYIYNSDYSLLTVITEPGNGINSISSADINNDGVFEIITNNANGILIYHTVTNYFDNVTFYSALGSFQFYNSYAVLLDDFDNDNYIDCFMASDEGIHLYTQKWSETTLVGDNTVCSGTNSCYSVQTTSSVNSINWTNGNCFNVTSDIIVSVQVVFNVPSAMTCTKLSEMEVSVILPPSIEIAFQTSNNFTGNQQEYFCNGETIHLYSPELISYEWYVDGILSGNDDSIVLNPIVDNLITLEGYNSDGCFVSASKELVSASLNTNVMYSGATAASNQNPFPIPTTYQWIDCNTNTILPGMNSQMYITNTSGDYAVILTNQYCIDTSDCVPLVVNHLGEDEITQNYHINIFPNPNNGAFNIQFDTSYTGNLSITNQIGQEVFSEFYYNTTDLKLQLSTLINGVYFLQLNSINGSQTYKFIVVK